MTPKEHADEIVVKFKEVARKVGASIDFFIRTTDPRHERFVQDFVQRCYDTGDIYTSSYSGLYCPACEAYYIEENLVDGLCPDHGTAPARMEEDNYFFRLSAFQDRLVDHYRSNPDFVRPRHRYNEALSFIEQGLDDISISRATLKWGIAVPWDPSQVIYVWVDALINYLSALHYAPGQDLVSRFWPASYHLMAQDILKFHGIIWPALLMSAGYELPEHLFIHGYLKLGGEKMSKTRGNVMDPFPLIEQYGADPFRFYCLREVSFGQDGMVSEEGFKARYNSELANELGNLLSRTTSMIDKYRGGAVPSGAAPRPPRRPCRLAALARRGGRDGDRGTVRAQLDEMDLSAALETIWVFVRRLNRYVEEQAPWKLAKEAAAAASGGSARRRYPGSRTGPPGRGLPPALRSTPLSGTWPRVCACCRCCCYPFIPETAAAIRERLAALGRAPLSTPGGRRAPAGTRRAGACCPDGLTVVTRRSALPAHRGLTGAPRAPFGRRHPPEPCSPRPTC